MMNMKEFSETILTEMRLKYPEREIFLQEIMKNNGVKLQGLIIRSREKNISPTIYLNRYYDDYVSGNSVEDLVGFISEVYEKTGQDEPMDISCFFDYEKAKERLAYKLVNYERNRELLKEIPYIPYLDLAIVFYCVVSRSPEGCATILVRNSHQELWHISTEGLYQQAAQNTERILPPELRPMHEIIGLPIIEEEDPKVGSLYVLTNSSKLNGAACVLYRDLLKNFAKKIHSDFFVIPSSVHETILLPMKDSDIPTSLDSMIREVNRTQVDLEEQLSDHVYYYDSAKEELCCPAA